MQLHSKKIPIVENVWEQIAKHNILEDNHISKVMAETALKSSTYNSPILKLNSIFQTTK